MKREKTPPKPSREPARALVSAALRRNIAFAMIGIAVVASYFITPLPVAIGMTVLAAIRLWIVWREERKDRLDTAAVPPCSADAQR
jgi:hypothetical protein